MDVYLDSGGDNHGYVGDPFGISSRYIWKKFPPHITCFHSSYYLQASPISENRIVGRENVCYKL